MIRQVYIIISIAIVATIISYYYPYKPEYISKGEKTCSNIILLYFIRFLHYCTFTFSVLYVFIFPMDYDIWCLGFSLILYVCWKMFKNECPFSLWEKQLLDPSYSMGEDAEYHPFIDLYSRRLNRFLVAIMFISLYIVFTRFCINILIRLQ